MRRSRQPSWTSGWATALAGIATAIALFLWSQNRATRFEDHFGLEANLPPAPTVNAEWFTQRMQHAATKLPQTDAVDTSAFPGTRIQGEDLLRGDQALARACRAELARWSASGELPIEADELRVVAGEEDAWQTLIVSASGTEAAALASLQHMLAAPGQTSGYFTDPARVFIEAEGRDRLRVELRLRIWPASSFVEEPGAQQESES